MRFLIELEIVLEADYRGELIAVKIDNRFSREISYACARANVHDRESLMDY